MTADLTFRNVIILDGLGGPPVAGDVSICEGRITVVGTGEAATREVDGRGMVLAPGFVDTHSHDDGAFLRYPGMEFKLAQGVTTEVSGNCGFSAAPNIPGKQVMPGDIVGPGADWEDLAGYFAAVGRAGTAINNAMLAGHNRVRAAVMGLERRKAEASELAAMRGHVARAMEQGAVGFSTGLIYEPGRYSDTEEVAALASEIAPYGGIYATHMRNEADRLLEAVEEALGIGREAGCGVHISHHKAGGRRNWGKVKDSLARIDRANAAGEHVTLDVYPYTAGSGPMNQYFDLAHVDLDLAAAIRIAACPDRRDFEGRMLTDIAEEHGWTLDEAVRQAVTGPRGKETICIQFVMDEADVETNLRHPLVMVGSDGIPNLSGTPHPRLFGTFPRVLGHYVRERGVLSLEEAVRRMTSLPCERFGLAGRGRIAEGYHADLVLFDPRTVRDVATYDEARQYPAGIAIVVVNGEVAWEDGRPTGTRSGSMLRRGVD